MRLSKRTLGTVSVVCGSVLLVAACGSSASDTVSSPGVSSSAPSSAGPAVPSSPETSSPETSPSETSSPAAPVSEGTSAADTVRNAITRFEDETKAKGGVTFELVDPNGGYKAVFNVTPDGGGVSEGKDETGASSQSFWSPDIVYTQVAYLNDEVKKLVKTINPEAKWFSEPRSTQYSLMTPATVAEGFLAYATGTTCEDKDGGKECTVTASGVAALPGLGTFQTPESNVTMVVTIKADGTLANVVVFPGNESMERQLTNVVFEPVNVVFPSDAETVTLAQVGAEAAKSLGSEAPADPSAVPSPNPS